MTTVRGNPCCLTTTDVKALATASAVVSLDIGTKCAIFEKRSIIVKTFSKLVRVFGKSVIKSIEMSVHGRNGIGRGYNNPYGF